MTSHDQSSAGGAQPPMLQSVGCGATDQGLERDQNEDNFLVDEDLGLYVVCDGMGGHARGEVAAATAVRVAQETLGAHQPAITGFMEGREGAEPIATAATQAIQAASKEIYELATTRAGHAGMGSTMTLLLVGAHQAVMAHVGDTRLYVVRGGLPYQLTTDHTMADELVRNGTLTAEQARGSRWAHVLTRSVGIQSSVQVDTLVFDVFPGDQLLLCSDGLSEYLTDTALIPGLLTGELEELPDALIAHANAGGGRDNITAVVVQITPDEPLPEGTVPLDADSQADLQTLQAMPLFSGLTVPQLMRILRFEQLKSVPKEEAVYTEGQYFDAASLLLEGRLRIVRNGRPVGLTSPGDCIGCGLAFGPRKTHAGLVAAQDSTVLHISYGGLNSLQQRRPRLANLLLTRLGHQLAKAVDSLHGGSSPMAAEATPPAESPTSDVV